MYKCQHCKKVVSPNTPAHRVVIETRRKSYPLRERVFVVKRNRRFRIVDDPGGFGYEIVKEITVCPCCADNLRGKHRYPD